MFNWTSFPESLDNSYDELQSTVASPSLTSIAPPVTAGPSTSQTSAPSPPPVQTSTPSAMLSLPRSASTSQIDSTSPTPHFETANASPYPLSVGTRPHQRAPLSETTSATTGLSRQSTTSRQGGSTLEPFGGGGGGSGFKAPPNSFNDGLSAGAGAGAGLRGQAIGLAQEAPIMPWWYTKKRADLPDFVLISEFSEVEGPRAVMTIPDSIVDLTRDSYSTRKQRTQESSTTKHSQDSSDASSSTLTLENTSNIQDLESMFDVHEFVLRITSVDHQARET